MPHGRQRRRPSRAGVESVSALQIIFWILLACPFYTMIGYPLLMLVVSRMYCRQTRRAPITPKVSQIIAAYNEERAIAGKLENSLSLDYPAGKLEIIVVSDASTDRTDEIVRSFADRGVKLVRCEGNQGKSAAINEAVRHATGEILAFSDATGHWDPESIRAMAEQFADPTVGCVSGWVAYRYEDNSTARGFKLYQRFIMPLRRAEGCLGSGFQVPGSIHCMRASAFRPLPPATFGDMVDPLHAAMAGLRTTLERQATAFEESRSNLADEWQARLRISLRAWAFVAYALPRLPLLRSPLYCFQVMSHKFLRWLVGPLMLPLLILNLLLLPVHWTYQAVFAGQVLFYGMTLLGYAASKAGRPLRGFSGLVFYNSVNLAYIISALRFLSGKRAARWVPTR